MRRSASLIQRWGAVLLIAGCAAGCIPARTPAVLDATAGSPVQVTGDRVTTTAFSAAYPQGWRVILGPADQPPFVTMAAPDNCTVVTVSTVMPDSMPTLPDSCAIPVTTEQDTRTIDGTTLYVSSASSDANALQSALTIIKASLGIL
ncbi:MAG: hypothetical protein U0670_05020 [Anaerolineae bacterium]